MAIVPLSFISVCILCEFAMLLDVYILLSPQEEEVHSSSCGNRCTHLAAHSSKRLNPLSVIILVCLAMIWSNTLQFEYFRDFNKCLQAIFFQLSFEKLWLYLLGARLFWIKIIKNYYQSPPKVYQMYSKKLRQFRKPNLNFIRVIKNSSFNQSFADDIPCSTLWMSSCVINSSATLMY